MLNFWVLILWIFVIVLCIFSLNNCIVYSFSIYNFLGRPTTIRSPPRRPLAKDTITAVVLKKYPKFNFIFNNFPFVGLGDNDIHPILYQFKKSHLETKVHSSNKINILHTRIFIGFFRHLSVTYT